MIEGYYQKRDFYKLFKIFGSWWVFLWIITVEGLAQIQKIDEFWKCLVELKQWILFQ